MSDDLSIPSPTYRVPRHSRGLDPGTRKLALIAAGIGGALVVIGGGWHMMSHHRQGVPVVQAESGPFKVKPANPGGLQVQGANNDIFSGGSDTDVEKLAPAPQTPDPQALREMAAAKPAAPPAEPKLAAAPSVVAAAPSAAVAAPPSAVAPPPAAVTAPRSAVAGSPARPSIAAVAPPASAPPAPARATEASSVQAAHAAAPPVAAQNHPAAARAVQVQLAALSSEQAAHQEWDRLLHRWPDLLHGHQPAFSKIDRDGRVFWRVRAGGFDGVSQATTFCERVRAKGGGCSVADF